MSGKAPRGTGGVGNSGGRGGGGGAAQSAADALDEPALGRPLPDKTFDSLREYGYTGSKEFTRAEALDFAMVSEAAWGIVCQVFNGPIDECMPDAWNWEGVWEGIKRLAEFTYQLTPVADYIDCASNRGSACAWAAGGFVAGSRILRTLDNIADVGKAVNLPSWRKIDIDMTHVLKNHTKDGAGYMQSGIKDKFSDYMSDKPIEATIRGAYRTARKAGPLQGACP